MVGDIWKARAAIPARLSPFALAVLVAIAAAIVAYKAASYYRDQFGTALSVETQTWGQFGDFFGGLVNPIVGLASIFLLVIVIYQQDQLLQVTRREMQSNRDVFDHEAFQSRFFGLLDLFVKCRAEQSLGDKVGHKAIIRAFLQASQRLEDRKLNHSADSDTNNTVLATQQSMEDYGATMAAYFRTFFAMLEYLELSKRQSPRNEPFAQVFKEIVFSALSDGELVVIFLFVAAVRAGKPPTSIDVSTSVMNECFLATQRALRPEYSQPISQMWTNITSRPR